MCSRVVVFLIGALSIYYQALAAEDIYVAELMVVSNDTLDAQTLLADLQMITSLQVNDGTGASHTVTLLTNEVKLTGVCLFVGDDINCNCSVGYTWSNEVCDTFGCCNDSTCTQNVTSITPLCIPKVQVYINGTVILGTGTWTSTQKNQLAATFQTLNGFQYLNITGLRQVNTIADFEVGVSVKFQTIKLQNMVTSLQSNLSAVIWVDTQGLITIEAPNTTVCYLSIPKLICTFEEETDSAGWNLTKQTQRYSLNNGTVVQLDSNCATLVYKSCAAVTLQEVTGSWEGIYECGFTRGPVRHTAKAALNVALLPDVITITINPLTGTCSQNTGKVYIDVTTTIAQSKETYKVWWSYRGDRKNDLYNTTVQNNLVYHFKADLSCMPSSEAQYVNITFANSMGQQKSARVDIPVIYVGTASCPEDVIDGDFWPSTPDGSTVINQTCPKGTTGYKSRTCVGTTWQGVFYYCVSQELNNISNAANNFIKGLGASQDTAIQIFEGLNNFTVSASSYRIDDISASINILNTMADATKYISLQDTVLPNFIDAASNLLNNSWNAVNTSTLYNMSATYLQSVEDLVLNIHVNQSSGINCSNLQLTFCSSNDCDVTVFGINVNMNMSNGIMKILGVKNLMNKLRNSFEYTEATSHLVSATLQDNKDSSLRIRMDFPKEKLNYTIPRCVFWDHTMMDWSDAGCIVTTSDNYSSMCECNHLTSFSVLMAKGDQSLNMFEPILEKITSVGLGVSICSLLIFLTIEYIVWSAVIKSNLAHFRHTAMVNIAVFRLLADCSFLASSSPNILTDSWCLTLTICKHLFYLAMFCWMLCLSVMLVHQLIFVFSPLRKRVFMFFSSIVGYVCPILIVGSSYVYYKYTYNLYYDMKTCWLIYVRLLEGSIHAFLLPVGTIILTNLFSMAVVIVTLVKTSVPDSSKADDKETAKSILKVVVFLTPVFGVTWVIGFFQLMMQKDNPMYAFVVFSFTILNSFQGLFILITGCFAEQKVREELIKRIMAKSKGKSESMKNLTSTTYTKDK